MLNVTELPEQTPNELVTDTARERAERIDDRLTEAGVDVEYTVEGHLCRDVAFDVLQTARDDGADLILMGYPEEHPGITETIEYEAPCDVVYADGDATAEALSTITIGTGGGPHQGALLRLANGLGKLGATVHLVNVTPTGGGGTGEDPEETLSELRDVESIETHEVTANSVAEGLVDQAAENGGILLIGASRDRRLRRWVFGSTPDRVIEHAGRAGVPVFIYSSTQSVHERLEGYLFPVYRYLRQKLTSSSRSRRDDSHFAE